MAIGGGEILRAVMSDPNNVADYSMVFYVAALNADNGTANATGTYRGFFQCKKDRYFLMTGAVPTATDQSGATAGFLRGSAPEFVRFFDPSTSREYAFKPPMQGDLISDTSYNWSFTFPEYILWEPASLIGIEWAGQNFHNLVDFKFLSLVGIEYGMKTDG